MKHPPIDKCPICTTTTMDPTLPATVCAACFDVLSKTGPHQRAIIRCVLDMPETEHAQVLTIDAVVSLANIVKHSWGKNR